MTGSGGPDLVLEARQISKTFSGKTVLSNFDLELRAGEVLAILGENGSGKSTFIKILSGFHAPDPGGTLFVRGAPVRLPLRAGEPATLGIGFVHQDLALFESGSVLENVRSGRYATSAGWRIPWRRERRHVARALSEFGLDVDPRTPVRRLGAVERAMIAIIRALDQLHGTGGAVLVLDEPTCYLPRDGVERLFGAIRDVARRGIGVLFVTHRLEEVSAITDRVTVLRDGKQVTTAQTAAMDEDELIETILGFALTDLYPRGHTPAGEVALTAHQVCGDVVRDISLQMRSGEILGVTGLVGMGFDELPYLLFGASERARGTLVLGDEAMDLSRLAPRAAVKAGMALLPANRARDGAVLDATAAENMTLLNLGRFFSRGRLRHQRARAEARNLMHEFDVRPRSPELRFERFSGGNQQKALLAKWLVQRPRVLLLHEPTQGVDIGARREIFGKMRSAADAGSAAMVASAEYEDLANLCDRVLVIRHGRVVGELAHGELTYQRLMDHVLRGRGESPAGIERLDRSAA